MDSDSNGQAFGVEPKGDPEEPNLVPKSQCVIEDTLTHSLEKLRETTSSV